jgi:hypothetical protein
MIEAPFPKGFIEQIIAFASPGLAYSIQIGVGNGAYDYPASFLFLFLISHLFS